MSLYRIGLHFPYRDVRRLTDILKSKRWGDSATKRRTQLTEHGLATNQTCSSTVFVSLQWVNSWFSAIANGPRTQHFVVVCAGHTTTSSDHPSPCATSWTSIDCRRLLRVCGNHATNWQVQLFRSILSVEKIQRRNRIGGVAYGSRVCRTEGKELGVWFHCLLCVSYWPNCCCKLAADQKLGGTLHDSAREIRLCEKSRKRETFIERFQLLIKWTSTHKNLCIWLSWWLRALWFLPTHAWST